MPEEKGDLVPAKNSDATKTIKAAPGGFQLQTVDDAVQFAKWNFESGLLPEHIRNTKQAFAIMARGAELGLKPHASWRWLYMTKAGKIAMETKGMLAVCQAQSFFAGYKEFIQNEAGPPEQWVAVAVAKRKGRDDQIKEFSYADAEKAGLLQKKRSRKTGDYIDGPYQLYLKDMLLARARQRALELQFGDVLGGMVSREVAQEVEDREEENGQLKRREPPKVTVEDPLMAAATGGAATPEVVEEEMPTYDGEVVEEEPEEPPYDEELPPQEEEAAVAEETNQAAECEGCGTVYHASRSACPECGLEQGAAPPPPADVDTGQMSGLHHPKDTDKHGREVLERDEKGEPVVLKKKPPEDNPFERGRKQAREMKKKGQQTLPKE